MTQAEQLHRGTESEYISSPRINYREVDPSATQAMLPLQNYVDHSSLPNKLLELVRMRASQINGCAYCLDMHSKDARAEGESEQRIYMLSAWRESPFYSDRERAALEWTETVTLVAKTHVPDKIYKRVRKYFAEKELIELTMAIITINGWNRLSISMRLPAGTYQPHQQEKQS
ncbi:MAG: carboxymuconolactone decarboxylase family protein [Nitrososphaerota archaeon]|nr:carboxymuconolactone decarboxylase family protein [Nitrososphaerota archaeon]